MNDTGSEPVHFLVMAQRMQADMCQYTPLVNLNLKLHTIAAWAALQGPSAICTHVFMVTCYWQRGSTG